LLKDLKLHWPAQKEADDKYFRALGRIERKMQRELKMPHLEFLHEDDGVMGIGTPTLPPGIEFRISDTELEKGCYDAFF